MSTSLNARSLVVVVALVAGFGAAFFAGEADARVPAGRLDSVSQGCGQIQDQYDRAVRDYEWASKHGTQAQYDVAFENLKSIIRQWNGSLCSRYFGSLIYRTNPVLQDTVTGGRPTLAPVTSSGSSSTGGSTSGTKATSGKVQSVLRKR